MNNADWMIQISPEALKAHFKQADGSSRPGMLFVAKLKQDEKVYPVAVRVFLSDDIEPRLRSRDRQAQLVVEYVQGLLQDGWNPSTEEQHSIVVGNAGIESVGNEEPNEKEEISKPWWKFW